MRACASCISMPALSRIGRVAMHSTGRPMPLPRSTYTLLWSSRYATGSSSRSVRASLANEPAVMLPVMECSPLPTGMIGSCSRPTAR